MKVQWNLPLLIGSIFLQLEEGQSFAAEGNETIDDSILVWFGYDNIIKTGQFTKYCAKLRKRAIANQKWAEFRQYFTEYDKERSDCMTNDESTYNTNEVQEMFRNVIQTEMATWCQANTDKNTDPNLPPTFPLPQQSANALTDSDLNKLANLLEQNLPSSPHRKVVLNVFHLYN